MFERRSIVFSEDLEVAEYQGVEKHDGVWMLSTLKISTKLVETLVVT